MVRFIFFSMVSLLLSGCSTTYLISYDTYLINSQDKSLSHNDDKFSFSFIPVSNGIYFAIKNNTNQSAYLVWDKSYFIAPSGNSFKALDYDAILVTDEVARKENNESPIPANSSFSRFTTSNTNVSKFQEYNSTTVNNYFTHYSYTTTINNEFFDIGAYWRTTLVFQTKNERSCEYLLGVRCEEIKNDILLNNKLGLGLFIKQKDEVYEYRFDFKVKQVSIYKIEKDKNILMRELKETSNFDYSPK